MKPLKLQPLYDALVSAGKVDPSTQPVIPMAIADAFSELRLELAPTDEEKKLLFESALLLTETNFRGLRADAQGVLMALYADNPGFEWREPEPAPEPAPETPEE